MRECANVLYDFNAGASVIAAFVNQHDFFIQRSQLITDDIAGDAETWDRLADPDAEPPGVESTLQSLVNEVKMVMQEESIIIKEPSLTPIKCSESSYRGSFSNRSSKG